MNTGYDFDYLKLKGRIVEKFGNQLKFAEVIGLSEASVSKKLTGKVDFDQTEVLKWCDILDIPIEQICDYFFSLKS